jgi:hypothetical protein
MGPAPSFAHATTALARVLSQSLRTCIRGFITRRYMLFLFSNTMNYKVVLKHEYENLLISDSRRSHSLGRLCGARSSGHSRILRARACLDLLAFCSPSSPDYMPVTSGTGRGSLALFTLHMRSLASRCRPTAIRWQRTVC